MMMHESAPQPQHTNSNSEKDSPDRASMYVADRSRRLMLTRSRPPSRDCSREFTIPAESGANAFLGLYSAEYCTDHPNSSSVNSHRSHLLSRASFSTNAGGDFKEGDVYSEPRNNPQRTPSPPPPCPENDHSGKGVLAKKFQEVGAFLSKVSTQEQSELADEICDVLDSLLQRYHADAKVQARDRSPPVSNNIFQCTMDDDYDDDVLHCGYLCKRGEWMPNYRKRFVVLLNSGHLRYYMDATCIEKRGELNFLKCLRVDFEGEYFSIHGNDNIWRFYCESEKKIQRWEEAFQQAFKLSQQGCSVNLCECTIMKKDGVWGRWKNSFITLDDRGKIRIFRDDKSCLVEETWNSKDLEWECYDTDWRAWPTSLRTTINSQSIQLAFPHTDKRTGFQRELARVDEIGGYAPSVTPHW